MYVPIDFLHVTFFTEFTFEALDSEVKLHVILHVAALVLPFLTYLTDESLSGAASVLLNDIHPLVEGFYDGFTLHLQVIKELQNLSCAASFVFILLYGARREDILYTISVVHSDPDFPILV